MEVYLTLGLNTPFPHDEIKLKVNDRPVTFEGRLWPAGALLCEGSSWKDTPHERLVTLKVHQTEHCHSLKVCAFGSADCVIPESAAFSDLIDGQNPIDRKELQRRAIERGYDPILPEF